MIAYLDTQAAVWLAAANTGKLTRKALAYIEKAEVRISPMVVLEIGYLQEIGRVVLKPQEIAYKLSTELGVTVCNYPFPIIAEVAISETWTRDPFDRLIVAHARANGQAALITADELIAHHYARTIW